jgi:membrane-bound lytic murein transglycosylase B
MKMKILMSHFFLPALFLLPLLASCAHHQSGLEQKSDLGTEIVLQDNAEPDRTVEDAYRSYVENLLVGKGLDRNRAHAMLNDPRVEIDPGFIVKNLFNSAPGPAYPSSRYMYYNPDFIRKGRAFIEQNQAAFDEISERYGVSPEIITAILVIETKLGTYTGKYRAFDVFVNLALATDEGILSSLKETYGSTNPALYREKSLDKARARGEWAVRELYALILLSERLNLDPLELKGSVAGALGPAQFIPTSFLKFGVDGCVDSRIDPFCMTDAIASIANYLKLAGWTDGEAGNAEQKKRTAIWIYNHHEIYVNTVLKIYGELKYTGANAGLGSPYQQLLLNN